ncbi:hemagglutinin/amebocyte aggregation factor-like isoform X2 [Ostrea edulis]|uniref:hemagglutinin/amebocyte aggregation factor-like isoform X2 n=1 Tax=Ostrea edulis TaxID=37623 RepID=UPI0024AEF6D1|nr:hemagglutinin/amebocyte aggregation factor-like isoform X2 [Ostrea edulis]
MLAIIFPLVLLLEGCISYWSWVNDYDQTFHFQCPKDQYLTGLESVFSKSHNDRKFNLRCTPSSSLLHSSCAWTDYVNVMDEPLVFQCPAGGIVNGIGSSHDDAYEDRKFEFRCCNISLTCVYNCKYTGWLNGLEGHLNYVVPPNQFIRGIVSFHNNAHEDRRFDLEVCSLSYDCRHSLTTPPSTTTSTTTTGKHHLFPIVTGNAPNPVPILG